MALSFIFCIFFRRLCVDRLIINNRTESVLGCHVLFSDTKTDLFSRSAAHRDRDDASHFGEELLCFHEWMLLRSEEVKERRETLYWCEKVLRNPPSNTLKHPLQGQIKALRSRLYLTCWKCFTLERAIGKANSARVFCQYGSCKLAHQTCRMSQRRQNNIITSVCAEMTTRGQMRLTCASGEFHRKKRKV